MKTLVINVKLTQSFEAEITDEQYELYQQSPGEFWSTYGDELTSNKNLSYEKVLEEEIEEI